MSSGRETEYKNKGITGFCVVHIYICENGTIVVSVHCL